MKIQKMSLTFSDLPGVLTALLLGHGVLGEKSWKPTIFLSQTSQTAVPNV